MHHPDPHTALVAAKSNLAALRVIRALQVLVSLTHKDFDPEQPRTPAGEPGAGQWTSAESDLASDFEEELLQTPTIGDDSEKPQDVSRRRTGPTGTPAQEARLAIATGQAREAITRVMDLDSTWRGPSSIIGAGDVEGQIAHQEAVAAAATARYQEILRSGYGSNSGSRNPAAGAEPARRSDWAPDAVTAYCNNYTTRDYDLAQSRGTIAITSVDGKPVFGVNSTAPGFTAEDRTAADTIRARLIATDPDTMATLNIGRMPNDALYHAETTALLRAAAAHSGSLQGTYLEIYVDKEVCDRCDKVLPLVARELGNPTVLFRERSGATHLLRNGQWY